MLKSSKAGGTQVYLVKPGPRRTVAVFIIYVVPCLVTLYWCSMMAMKALRESYPSWMILLPTWLMMANLVALLAVALLTRNAFRGKTTREDYEETITWA